MTKILLTMALLLVTATSADAADRRGRSNSRSSFNDYGTSYSGLRSRQNTYYFPQNNRMIIEDRSESRFGSSSTFYSTPIQQFGAPGINYQYYGNGTVNPYASGLIESPRGIRPPGW